MILDLFAEVQATEVVGNNITTRIYSWAEGMKNGLGEVWRTCFGFLRSHRQKPREVFLHPFGNSVPFGVGL